VFQLAGAGFDNGDGGVENTLGMDVVNLDNRGIPPPGNSEPAPPYHYWELGPMAPGQSTKANVETNDGPFQSVPQVNPRATLLSVGGLNKGNPET
jgi:hypothetical protein